MFTVSCNNIHMTNEATNYTNHNVYNNTINRRRKSIHWYTNKTQGAFLKVSKSWLLLKEWSQVLSNEAYILCVFSAGR